MSRGALYIIFASVVFIGFTKGDSEEHPEDWDDYWEDHWEEFDELVKTGGYVDKTPLLKWFIAKRRHLAIIAPPKLGRTTNQLMMRRFYEVPILPLDEKGNPIKEPQTWDQTVFKDLAVCKERKFCSEHFQKYPVIYLDFIDLNTTSGMTFYHSLRYMTTYMFGDHDYLRNSQILSEKELEKFIKYRHPRGGYEDDFVAKGGWLLSDWLHKHFNQSCIVLIDNFDHPAMCLLNATETQKKQYLSMLRPLQDFVVKLVRGNDRVHHSLFIASRRIDDYLTKEMTSLVYQPVFQSAELTPFYGFSEAEIRDVVKRARKMDQYKSIVRGLGQYKTEGGETVYTAFSMHDYLEAEEKEMKKREEDRKNMMKMKEKKKKRWSLFGIGV